MRCFRSRDDKVLDLAINSGLLLVVRSTPQVVGPTIQKFAPPKVPDVNDVS